MQSLKRWLIMSLSSLAVVSVTACALPVGVEFREMHVSRIDVPLQAKRGQAVDVTLINPVTPQGDASVSVQVDDVRCEVTFIVTEYELKPLIGGRAYPQMVVERALKTTFTPHSSGVYQLRTRGGVATASMLVEE